MFDRCSTLRKSLALSVHLLSCRGFTALRRLLNQTLVAFDRTSKQHTNRAFCLWRPTACILTIILGLRHVRMRHWLYPSLAALPHDRVLIVCPDAVEEVPHSFPQSQERLLSRSRIHGIFREIVEEYAIHHHESNQAPLYDLGPLIPRRTNSLLFDPSFEFALEAELLLLGKVFEVWRPLLPCEKAIT